jgi:hypothetical protein
VAARQALNQINPGSFPLGSVLTISTIWALQRGHAILLRPFEGPGTIEIPSKIFS